MLPFLQTMCKGLKMYRKNSHCSYCGQVFPRNAAWPRACTLCGNITFLNPLPVAVVLVPVDDGILVIRRGIAPHVGKPALPGGYINLGESWQEAGAREVLEEACVSISPEEIREVAVRSGEDETLLIFGIAERRASENLPPFHPTDESLERLILKRPENLAFGLHTEIVRLFFAGCFSYFHGPLRVS